MRRLAFSLGALVLTVTACPRTTAGPSPSPTAGATQRPPSVEIIAQNIRIVADTDRPVRIGIVAAEPLVRVIVTYPDTRSIVSACAIESFDARVPVSPVAPHCRSELPSGVRETLSSRSPVAAVAVWVSRGDPVTASLHIEYAQGRRPRPIRLGLPVLAAPEDPARCRDNECNPLIEIKPIRGGTFTARARWRGGEARFALLQGRLLARSFTATGVPYSIAAQERGAGEAQLDARLSAPAEYGLVIDQNRAVITNIVIESSWP